MDIYTLDETFQKKSVIDAFSSFIWTERYGVYGDFNLVLPVTSEAVGILAEGSFLSIPESKEVMLIETQSVDKGLLTVTGNTLLGFLKHRAFGKPVGLENRSMNIGNRTVGNAMSYIADAVLIQSTYVAAPGGVQDKIPNLTLGVIDNTGAYAYRTVPFGPLYDILKTLAESEDVGMSLFLESVINGVPSLKFTAYRGLNRTSAQTDRPIVRFSPGLDSLTNVKELRSIAEHKNIVYSFAPSTTPPLDQSLGEAYTPPNYPLAGFNRRVMLVFLDDLTTDTSGGNDDTKKAILYQRAKLELGQHKPSRMVDGEVVPGSEFQYGVHYGLGDIVELQGYSGLTQNARITEYIRTQDETGVRAYPTVSVI